MFFLGYIKSKLAAPWIVIGLMYDFNLPSAFWFGMACGAFGLFGGAIYQLRSHHDVAPTARFIVGDLMLSSGLGFCCYAFTGVQNIQILGSAILAGLLSTTIYSEIVLKWRPHWLPKTGDKEL